MNRAKRRAFFNGRPRTAAELLNEIKLTQETPDRTFCVKYGWQEGDLWKTGEFYIRAANRSAAIRIFRVSAEAHSLFKRTNWKMSVTE